MTWALKRSCCSMISSDLHKFRVLHCECLTRPRNANEVGNPSKMARATIPHFVLRSLYHGLRYSSAEAPYHTDHVVVSRSAIDPCAGRTMRYTP